MGDKRLGRLSKTYKWQQVVRLLEGGGDVSAIASFSLDAAKAGLERASHDPAFVSTLSGIFEFLDCAASKDFVGSLQERGFALSRNATTLEILESAKRNLDLKIKSLTRKSDLAELAQNSFTAVLIKHATSSTGSLLNASPDTIHRNLQNKLKGQGMKSVMHDFFASFTSRYLSYHLGRELPNHIGSNKRFADLASHHEFGKALDLYVRQTIRITDEFTPGWFGKARFKGTLDTESVSGYAHVAIKKICREFDRGGGRDL